MFHRNKHRRHRRPGPRGLFFLLVAAGAIAFFGFIVMTLWNAILPPVTGVQPLSYWQAVGLLILSRILFGGMPRPPFAYRKRGSHWREKWKNISKEDRERYREAWRNRCKPGKDKPEEEV